MLLELNISNFAIIDDLNIQFTRGLNLLTGETGSGKSIIIEALGIILGGRGTKDLIRTGEKRATLQAVFHIEDLKRTSLILDRYGLDIDEDSILIISREIMNKGPSISRINGKTVTLSILNKVSSSLVDIFAQREHQSLLDISNHKELIDSFGDENFINLKSTINMNYRQYKKEKLELEEMNMDESQRNREIDLLQFQIDEINSANLSNHEEDIENEYNRLSNIRKIMTGLSKILESFDNYDFTNFSILNSINSNIGILNDLVGYDYSLRESLDRLESVSYELGDINNDLKNYLNHTDVDEEKLYILQERIDLINKLKRKYGTSIDEILNYRDTIEEGLNKLLNFSEEVEARLISIRNLEKSIYEKSKKISNLRKKIAKNLEVKISNELAFLNMDNVVFKVDFKENKDISSDGIDHIEFLISTNIGEKLKSMSRIVSGGEMSRIMLAFKTIFAEHDKIPSLIFDEIDSGISGRTAQIVGEKIYRIAKNHQVISVSHLPQIAALADSHYVISKNVDKSGKIATNVKKLNEKERVEELARLLGGVDVTDTTLNHAREMLEMSKTI